jgi:cytoskeletal protein CcmA (bactofilin family)
MSEYLPIEIRHLDKTSVPLSSTDVFPVVIGSESEGFETRKTSILDVLNFVNSQNQDFDIRTLSVRNSAYIQNNLAIGNVTPDANAKLYVDGNVVISGSLSSLGTSTVFNTQLVTTSSLSLNAAGGVSLSVDQDFEHPIAQFFDGGNIAMHIDGSSERPGYVGINTTNPNTHLTVLGNISARDYIYSDKLNTNSAYLSSISANKIVIDKETYIGVNKPALTNIGNISGGNVFLNGNVYVNTTSLSTTSTVIGNDLSDVYINGDLFVKNLSANGNVLFNTLSGQRNEFTLGNFAAINNLLGTNILSGFNYLNGDVYINTSSNGNSYINTNENAGVLEIGSVSNQLNIKSGNLTVGNVITSEVIKLDFTDYDVLTSTMDEVFSTSNVIFSSLTVATDLTSVSSFRYRVLNPINGLNIDLINQTIDIGDAYTEVGINSNNFGLSALKTLNLNSKAGGSINIGSKEVVTTLNGYDLNINNDNDDVIKNTHINSGEGSGNVYIGNSEGETQIFGNTQINTLSAYPSKTVIGSLCSKVDIYNLNVLGGFTADIPFLKVTNFETDNLTTINAQKMLGGFNSSQSCAITGDLKIKDKLILESGVVEGNVTTMGIISAPNLNIGGWDIVYTTFQAESAAWGTGGVAQQLFFDPATNILSQTYGNSVSLVPLLYNAVNLSNASFVSITGADVRSSNFVLTGEVGIEGSFNQGYLVLASGNYSHAEGHKSTAGANYSHSEGYYTRTGANISFDYYYYQTKRFTFSQANSGIFSYLTPGYKIRVYEADNLDDIFTAVVVSRDNVTGEVIVSEDLIGRNSNNGYIIDNSGTYSHAEGSYTVARGLNSHAEGFNTIASGENSHSEGINTVANGNNSHAAGINTETNFDRTWIWQGTPEVSIFSATKNDQFAIKAASGVYIASNVGINTDNSSNALTVNGDISSNSNLYVDKNAFINGDILIYGSLSALGQYTVVETQVGVTSALEITNVGSGPALKVTQTGFNNVAEFYDGIDPIFVLADNLKVGIGTQTPSTTLHLSGTDALVIPVGNTAQRIGVQGAIRYNSQDSTFEGYDGSNWGSLGGVKDIDQNTYISAEDYPGANNNQLKFVTNGTEKAIIQPDGKVGVGTTTPNEILTIVGNISADNNLFVQSITASGNILVQSITSTENVTFNKDLNILNNLTVIGNISSQNNIFVQSLTAFENSKFNKNLEVTNDLTVSNVFNLSAVTFTGEVYTNVTSITAQNQFIKVIADGQTKYIRLYDIE